MGGTDGLRRLDFIDPTSKLERMIIKNNFLLLLDVVNNRERFNIGGPEYTVAIQLAIEGVLINGKLDYTRLEYDKYLVNFNASSLSEAEMIANGAVKEIKSKEIDINSITAKKSSDTDLTTIMLHYALKEKSGDLKADYATLNERLKK